MRALSYVPVSNTFAAGVIPGIILLILMVLLVLFKCRHIRADKKATFKERLSSFVAALPALITPIIILGGIYAGFLTPSESAAVAGVYAVAIGFFIYRELTFNNQPNGIFSIYFQQTILKKGLFRGREPRFPMDDRSNFDDRSLFFYLSIYNIY